MTVFFHKDFIEKSGNKYTRNELRPALETVGTDSQSSISRQRNDKGAIGIATICQQGEHPRHQPAAVPAAAPTPAGPLSSGRACAPECQVLHIYDGEMQDYSQGPQIGPRRVSAPGGWVARRRPHVRPCRKAPCTARGMAVGRAIAVAAVALSSQPGALIGHAGGVVFLKRAQM